MYSTPEPPSAVRRLLPFLLLATSIGGCAGPKPHAYTRPPLIVDGAMQRREWERSVAAYPNGDTVSGHNRFPIRTGVGEGESEFGGAALDIGASMVQTVALPFTYFFIPPFARAVYTGEDIGPSYTAMPQMRPASTTVRVEGLVVDRDTLQVGAAPRQARDERYRRYGPMGPGDAEFDSNQPSPALEQWE